MLDRVQHSPPAKPRRSTSRATKSADEEKARSDLVGQLRSLWWCFGWLWDVALVVRVQSMADDKVESPTLTGGLSPRAIRAAVLEEERPGFERQYREAMAVAVAAETLDLAGVEELLRAWQRIAELTERDGRENRRRVLAKAVLVWRNRDIPRLRRRAPLRRV